MKKEMISMQTFAHFDSNKGNNSNNSNNATNEINDSNSIVSNNKTRFCYIENTNSSSMTIIKERDEFKQIFNNLKSNNNDINNNSSNSNKIDNNDLASSLIDSIKLLCDGNGTNIDNIDINDLHQCLDQLYRKAISKRLQMNTTMNCNSNDNISNSSKNDNIANSESNENNENNNCTRIETCPICHQKRGKTSHFNFEKHLKAQHKYHCTCENCALKFTSWKSLINHVKIDHPNHLPNYFHNFATFQ